MKNLDIKVSNELFSYQKWNSFTALHTCFADEELFNADNPREFKHHYMGRIEVSTGTINPSFRSDISKTKRPNGKK